MQNKQKHPKGLYILFFTEMWERFSYYGMRALLVLYLTTEYIDRGFGMQRANALEIYAIFTGLVYINNLLGGLLADKFIGQRKAIYIGAFLMALGQFSLAISEFGDISSRTQWLNLGLGLLVMGTGIFKPNISTIVGKLYSDNDPRKDSAFTIFYMGINIGAFISPLIAGAIGEKVDWFWGFIVAGLGMIISTIWFYSKSELLGAAGFPAGRTFAEGEKFRLNKKDRKDIFSYVVAITFIVWGFLKLWGILNNNWHTGIIWTIGISGLVGISYIIGKNTSGKDEWSRVAVILVLCFFNVFFWSGFEQAGGTFNLFARENTNRILFNWEIPASYFQSVGPILIILLAPVFSMLWMALTRINKNPNTPVKFALGLIMLGLGFVVMSIASTKAGDAILVSPLWLLAVYFLHTTGELCLSPIGLSMITKLSPPKIVSIMMGMWFFSTGLANYLAGALENILHKHLPEMPLFNFLTLTSITGGLILLIISPILKKLMKGIN